MSSPDPQPPAAGDARPEEGVNLDRLRATFRVECLDLLAELEEALLDLEQDTADADRVARVFRALHTIKGSGAMFGFTAIVGATHALETAFEAVRSGKVPCSPQHVALALSAKDLVSLLLAAPIEGDPALDEQVRRLVESTEALGGAVRPATTPSNAPAASATPATSTTPDLPRRCIYRVRFRPQPELLLDGTNPAGLWKDLRKLGRCEVFAHNDELPSLEELDPEHCLVWWDAVVETDRGEDAIRDVFIFVEDRGELRIECIDDGGATPVDDADYHKLGEILVQRGDVTKGELAEVLRRRPRLGEVLRAETGVPATAVEAAVVEQRMVREARAQRASEAGAEERSVRVAAGKLDSLVDLVGELVIAKARLQALAAQRDDLDLSSVAENIDRLSADLRDTALNLRMVPIGTTFFRFRRLVRDLAGSLGKEIVLETEGAETELDKTVIERLGDPLVHLIRNCCDHGIESPEERRAAGKPAAGTVHLGAYQSGPNVVIEIRDDGRGLDAAAIRAKAIARGLIAEDAELSDGAVQQLIFHAGLSTASRVTDVSGRGVGMDVVKQAVEGLRGTIELSSTRGAGTTVRIRLPLTLAIIEGLLVAVGGGRYVLPMSMVQECVEITRADVEGAHGSHLAPVRGELVPYLRLREWFGVDGERPPIEQIAIANAEGVRFGLVVDDVIGQHQTVIKSLGRMYRDVNGLSGATILGDGTVALIIDVARVMRAVMPDEQGALEARAQSATKEQQWTS